MDISLRLKTVANQVANKTMADIGTDHGYVPIYLALNGKIEKAIACDINKGPLLKANKNIAKENLNNKIETRLGSGLSPIHVGEVETAVIAGMGGMLTIQILKDSSKVVNSLKQLVLSPHLDVEKVRRYIHLIGFKIIDEVMLMDDGKFYTVISAVKGTEKYNEQKEYAFGKVNIDKKCPVLKKYLEHKINKLANIEDNLKKATTENSATKLGVITAELQLCKEALEAYEMF